MSQFQFFEIMLVTSYNKINPLNCGLIPICGDKGVELNFQAMAYQLRSQTIRPTPQAVAQRKEAK